MPRYFFHLLDESGQNLMRDSEGLSLPDVAVAKKEATGLARDIVGHGLHQPTWQVVVTDANADTVLAVPLSESRPRKIKAWLALARRIAMYEPKLRPHIFSWLIMAAVTAMFIQAALLTNVSRDRAASYRIAWNRSYWAVIADEARPDLLLKRDYHWRHGVRAKVDGK